MRLLPTLIILGGLPGSGKTSLARLLCEAFEAMHIRIDTVEQVIMGKHAEDHDLEDLGYRVGYEMARDNLRLGRTVVADSVNPVEVSRRCWREVATSVPVPYVEVEILCADEAEHEERVRTRISDIPGMVLPAWQKVVDRHWEPWTTASVRMDTAGRSLEDCASDLAEQIVTAIRTPTSEASQRG